MNYIEGRFRSLYFTMLFNFVLFGVTLTIIGATLPKIIREFHWSYIATGFVISAGFVGYFASTFICGILVHRIGPRLVIVGGLTLQAIGLSLFASRSILALNLLLNFLIGFGQGGTEVVTNFSVVRMERSGQSRLMNLMHAAFAIGGIIGPLIVGALISIWQIIYRIMSLVSLLMAGTLSLLPFLRLGGWRELSGDEPRVARLLRNPLLILSFVILLLYVGTEMGVSTWVSEYYVKTFGTTARVGAYMVSLLWLGLFIGRLSASLGYRGRRQAKLIFLLSSVCTLSLLFAVLMKSPWLAAVGFFCAGLGFSAIYPLVMALIGYHFKSNQGIAIGFASTGGGVGLFASPFLMAAISDVSGIQRGFFFYIALDFLMVLLTCIVIWQTRIPSQPIESKWQIHSS